MPPALLVFSHLRWDFVFQRPQHLLSRLAHQQRVIVIEEPVMEAGALARFDRFNPCDNVLVLRPVTGLASQGFQDDQIELIRPLIRRLLAQEQVKQYVAWFYSPMAFPLLDSLSPQAVVYDCMDEPPSGASAQMRQREADLLARADLVLTGGPSLFESKRGSNANVHCLASSVDAAHYAPEHVTERQADYFAAEKLQSHILAPRIGYFGIIDERVDLALITALADARPDWHIVMVGPVIRIDEEDLPKRSNLHWLGQQPYARLPALVAGWDVCLLPFALNEHTRFISPTKTLEYLAAEKPVVSTPVHDVVAMYGDVVALADTRQAFVAACEAALNETPDVRADRMARGAATVARYSWDEATRRVKRLMEQAVERNRPAGAMLAAA